MSNTNFFATRRFWGQFALLVIVATIIVGMIETARHNLQAQGLTSGFAFLERSTGWNLSFSLIEYSPQSTYARVLLVGFLNTLTVGFLSLALASVFGVLIGMARVSANATLRMLGTSYVELFRNIPLLMQVMFWYAIMTHLPAPKLAEPMLGSFYFTAAGIYLPAPALQGATAIFAVLLAFFLLVTVPLLVGRVLRRNGGTLEDYSGLIGLLAGFSGAALALLAVAAWDVEPGSNLMSIPAVKGFRIEGGLRIVPEFSALVMALVLYGTAYIGEIVRGGLQSVSKGQLEAANALGLSPSQVYWRIRFPLAVRSILPMMGNQYIWLMKGTTAGLAIGFSDLFMVASVSINQSGQTLEIMGLLMLGFLIINLGIGRSVNLLNNTLALKGTVRSS